MAEPRYNNYSRGGYYGGNSQQDQIRRLEWETEQLRAQLAMQNEQARRARDQAVYRNRQELQQLQAQMQDAVRRHDAEAQARYERLLEQHKQALERDVRAELSKSDANYGRLEQEVKRSEQELERKNRELEQAIEELKKDASRKNEGSSEEAQAYIDKATETYRTVQAKPHRKFAPNRLKIYTNSIQDSLQLMKAGLYEAAAAVAISARSGLERLGYTIDDKYTEWERIYDMFALKLQYLRDKAEQELSDWREYVGITGNAEAQRADNIAEIAFWSRGEYTAVLQTLERLEAADREICGKPRTEYMKQPDSLTADDLKKNIADIEAADKKLAQLKDIYKSRYTASCERSDWGEKLIDFMTGEIDLEFIEKLTGYRKASAETLRTKEFKDYTAKILGDPETKEDLREWLRIVFENAAGARIYIYITPTESGSDVTNRIIMHIDNGGKVREEYSRDIYSHIVEALAIDPESINYAPDATALAVSPNRAISETGKDLERALKESR